jgi:hypothetical protein
MPSVTLLPRQDKPQSVDRVITLATANQTRRLSAKESGAAVIFGNNGSQTAILPPPQKGLTFTFFVKVASSSGTGHFIDPNGTVEKLFAKSFTAAGGKGAVNTQATSAIGDAFTVWSDGTDWFGIAEAGTWAREA